MLPDRSAAAAERRKILWAFGEQPALRESEVADAPTLEAMMLKDAPRPAHRAPTPQEEDRRRVCRERRTLVGERVKHVNRIKGLLFAQGVFGYEPLRKHRHERLEDLRTGDGRPLPVHLKAQIIRELDRLELVLAQLKTVAAERDALLKSASDEIPSPPAMLVQLKGIGPESAAVLWSEGLFRRFDNRRQVAAYAGLAPTPWQSGSIDHEQGVSKAGNPRLRTTMVELVVWR